MTDGSNVYSSSSARGVGLKTTVISPPSSMGFAPWASRAIFPASWPIREVSTSRTLLDRNSNPVDTVASLRTT